MKVCERCPAFIWSQDSIATGLCLGCRSPAGAIKVEGVTLPAETTSVLKDVRIWRAVEVVMLAINTAVERHKQWVIDQMLRVLLGDEYEVWVQRYPVGPNGEPDHYGAWDTGVAP